MGRARTRAGPGGSGREMTRRGKFARVIGFACSLCVLATAWAAEVPNLKTVPLWPDGSPNNPAAGPRPTMEIYLPFSPEHAIPATIVICPGGGYGGLSPYERLF